MLAEIVLTKFDYVAFGAMAVVFFGLIYFVIWVGDLPASIARARNHPQVPAVQALAWMGLLFTGGVVYVLAFAWAYWNYPQTVHSTDSGENAGSDVSKVQEKQQANPEATAADEDAS